MSAKPRILHLITRWMRGGAEEKTLGELRGLSHSYEFTLAHGGAFDAGMAERVDALGITRRVVPELRHLAPLSAPRAVRALQALLRREAPDILHVHSTEAGVLGRVAAARVACPSVYTLHGLPFESGGLVRRIGVMVAERRLAGRTARFLANSASIRDAYLRAGIGRAPQYAVVPSGVDLAAVGAAQPAQLPGGRPRVLFAGRLESGKGLRRTVRAVETLRREGLPVDLVVAGVGPLADELPDWVHRLGYRTDLPSVIRSSDVVALPSSFEGTPRTLTEAMALGVPIVASAVGGIPEQVGDAGILVPPHDARALADALRSVLTDATVAKRLAERGGDRAGGLSLDAMLSATDAVYQDVLAQRAKVSSRPPTS